MLEKGLDTAMIRRSVIANNMPMWMVPNFKAL